VRIASGYQVFRVASFYGTNPEGRPGGLRWRCLSHLRCLQVFIVGGNSQEGGELPGSIGAVDINTQVNAITHGDHDIPLLLHTIMSWLTVIIRWRCIGRAGERYLLIHYADLQSFFTRLEDLELGVDFTLYYGVQGYCQYSEACQLVSIIKYSVLATYGRGAKAISRLFDIKLKYTKILFCCVSSFIIEIIVDEKRKGGVTVEKIRLGRTNMVVSRIGLGGIPIQKVSEKQAIATVRRSLDLGVSFIDTSDNYATSEERIGKAIAGRQQGLILATKISYYGRDEVKKYLHESLTKLGVKSLDLYQFHSISDFKTLETILAPGGALSVVQEAKKAGQVKHIGISSHHVDVAKEAIKSGHFETIMFPFNFIACEAADELLPLAREHDLGFIAIKSLAGGRIQNINIAIKYLLQFPDVVVLPGIEKPREIEEIVKILEKPEMTAAEQKEMQRLRERLSTRFCRHCDRCLPCPEGVPIGMVMDFEAIVRSFTPESIYTGHFGDMIRKAAACNDCGDCEEKCPYHIPIRAIIHEYINLYETGKKEYEAGLRH
jgi:predicted aldo/keto reductase-like oxidoreductase